MSLATRVPGETDDTVAGLLAGLIRIDSQNPALRPGSAGEAVIAQHCVKWFADRGIAAWLDEVAPGRPNVVARLGSGDGPSLVLCAHLDTVSAEGMDMPFDPRVDAGRMYGRGAYDMKGGVAAVMAAMAALTRRPPRGTVMAALVADEEYASIGAADFVKRYPADACILTEPSDGRLILAHKGFVWLEIEVTGTAAHGSRWEDGASAISRMAAVVHALDTLDRAVLRHRAHPLAGPASMHCATIQGGVAWSTYAPSCTLRVERRTLPGETVDDVVKEIAACVQRTGVQTSIRVVLHRSPLECAPDSAIAAAVRSAVVEMVGAVPADAGVAYWMDAAIFADAGVETVNYGPTGAGAHAAVEWVDMASVADCALVLEEAARTFCG